MIFLCNCVTPNLSYPPERDVEWAVEVQLGGGFVPQTGRIEIFYKEAGMMMNYELIQGHGEYNLIQSLFDITNRTVPAK